ncbi:MAG TPA: cytochrome b/b6 domain-containing protein [Gammaproteobacteria bacterium]|nr:cytochrome b/b6 domain-containing protein [Gammaproteobacteria bacterium]
MNNENTVQVWDIVIRIFHWSLVIAFVIAYFTAEEENPWHIYSGYAVLGLITFRVFWGLVGSKYARFSNFIYSPGKVVQYLKELAGKKPGHYLGHNPAGGYMIILLLSGLFVVTVSGLKLYAVEEGRGPLAGTNNEFMAINNVYADEDDDDDNEHENNGKNEQDEEFWEEIHELSTNFTLVLIFLHIAGVFVSSRLHNENLVKAMITGRKKA